MRENKSIILHYRWLFLIFVQISWTKSSMKSWVFINNLLHTSGLKSSVNCYCNCNVSRRISISLLTLLPKFLECVKSFILDINWGYLPTLGNAQWCEYHFFQPIWCWKMIWALILDAIKIVITPFMSVRWDANLKCVFYAKNLTIHYYHLILVIN